MRHRILIVAQDVALRSTLARWLMAAGYSVELADNDRQAREVLANHRVALTIVAPTAGAPMFDPGAHAICGTGSTEIGPETNSRMHLTDSTRSRIHTFGFMPKLRFCAVNSGAVVWLTLTGKNTQPRVFQRDDGASLVDNAWLTHRTKIDCPNQNSGVISSRLRTTRKSFIGRRWSACGRGSGSLPAARRRFRMWAIM